MNEGKVRLVETHVMHWHARAHLRTHSRTHKSVLSLVAFLLKHKHTHWISSHSSWLKTPMAVAGGIHSPRMLGQLCWYWMRHSWSCLSLYAARDKKKKKKTTHNYMLLNLKSILSLPRHAQLIMSLSCTSKGEIRISVKLLLLTHERPPPLCHRADNTGSIFTGPSCNKVEGIGSRCGRFFFSSL